MLFINKNRTIGSLIAKTRRAIAKKLEARFRENNLDLTIEQFRILILINENEEAIQQDLVEAMNKVKSVVLRQIDSLERKRLIVRMTDPADRRKKNLVLTKPGMQVLEEALKVEALVMQEIRRGISDPQLESFINTLNTILSNAEV